MSAAVAPGTLTLVGTPIGNLEDLSPRAAAALIAADVVLCEDTRRTRPLLQRIGAAAETWSLHEHNELAKVDPVLEAVSAGRRVALVSDAGMPLVSDPGYPLVRAAVAAGLPVAAVPGPSAALLALVLSGEPPLPHAVFGFLPPKPGARDRMAADVADWPHTAILYVSPHRGAAELEALAQACGPRPAALARELTKRHEEVRRGRLDELAAAVAADPARGEWTLVIGPLPAGETPAPDMEALLAAVADRAAAGEPEKDAAFAVATDAGLPRRAVYKELLKRKQG